MAEETGTQTMTESVATESTVTTEATTEATVEATPTEATEAETSATIPFSKENLNWDGWELTDEQKDNLVENYSKWFKDTESANAYLSAIADANKKDKEAKAQKVADFEAGQEKLLRTDPTFGKDYDGNTKKVSDYLSKHLSESEMAEFKKFGFDKSALLNRMVLSWVNEVSDARVTGIGKPAPVVDSQPRDRWGNTMFDFTKKQ